MTVAAGIEDILLQVTPTQVCNPLLMPFNGLVVQTIQFCVFQQFVHRQPGFIRPALNVVVNGNIVVVAIPLLAPVLFFFHGALVHITASSRLTITFHHRIQFFKHLTNHQLGSMSCLLLFICCPSKIKQKLLFLVPTKVQSETDTNEI